jgi:thymidylate synthase
MALMIDYGDDWQKGYIDLCARVSKWGEVKPTRGGDTMEVRDFIFTLGPNALDLPLGTGRNPHVPLAAAEAIQLCAGVGMPSLTEGVSKRIAEFVRDPDGTVHGNYGQRVGLQIIDVIDKMRADPHSRQAVIQVWDSTKDSRYRQPMPKDIPCTLSITFGLSHDAVTMSVVMRSNDVWLGVPYDVFQFRQLQRTIAAMLGRPVGQYCHHAVSMHAYDHDLGKMQGLALEHDFAFEPLPTGIQPTQPADLTECFHRILMGLDTKSYNHKWYHERLGEAYASIVG